MSRTRRWVDPRYIKLKLHHDNVKDGYTSTTLKGGKWLTREAKWLDRVLRGPENHHGTICASAKEDVLNKWDDASSNYGKETANRKIRRWHKRVTTAALQEHYINVQLDAEEAKSDNYDMCDWDNGDHWEDEYDDWSGSRKHLEDLNEDFRYNKDFLIDEDDWFEQRERRRLNKVDLVDDDYYPLGYFDYMWDLDQDYAAMDGSEYSWALDYDPP